MRKDSMSRKLRGVMTVAGALFCVSSSAFAADPFGGSHATAPERPSTVASSASDADGVYGRFDGDLALSVGAGTELSFDPFGPRALGVAALRYYSLVGVYATYREALRDGDPTRRGASAGVLIEPLFLLRWTEGLTTGSAFWDLTIDSVGLSMGTYLGQPSGRSFADARSFEFGVGGGVPLFAWAKGLWLRARGNLRWNEEGQSEPMVWLTAEWQGFFGSGLTQSLGERP